MEDFDGIVIERWRDENGERSESDMAPNDILLTTDTGSVSAEALNEMSYRAGSSLDIDAGEREFSFSPPFSGAEAQIAMVTTATEDGEQQQFGIEHSDDSAVCDIDDLSPLEYARHYGLVASHFHKHPFDAVEDFPFQEIDSADLEDPESTLSITDILSEEAFLRLNAPEKLDVNKDTAAFLASVLALAKVDNESESLQQPGAPLYLRDLKLEEPILSSDPELDLWRLRRRNTISISAEGMEPFHVDNEKGDGLGWSTAERQAHTEIEHLVTMEKLDIAAETLMYLKDEILIFSNPATNSDILSACIDDRPVCLPQPESSPLLPISPPLSPFVPPPEALNMVLTSSPADLTAQEALRLEQHILAEDYSSASRPTINQDVSFDASLDPKVIYSPLRTPQDSSSSPLRRKTIQDLEVDVPLLPEEPAQPKPKKNKTVSFPPTMHTMIPTPDADMSICDSERGFDSFMTEVVTPLAESATREVENERLSEFDTTMRVKVPNIEEVELERPWKRGKDDQLDSVLQKGAFSQTKVALVESDKKWGGVSKVERLLSWSPFPTRLGKVQLDEPFDDGSLARYMAEIAFEDRVDLGGLVWKPEGLRILDAADSDDEELECLGEDADNETHHSSEHRILEVTNSIRPQCELKGSTVSQNMDSQKTESRTVNMQTLLRKRKLELQGGRDVLWPNKQSDRSTDTNGDATLEKNRSVQVGNMGGMSAFMRLNGGDAKIASIPSKQRAPTLQQFAPPALMVQPATNMKESVVQASLPTPELRNTGQRKVIILSPDLARNRALMRLILKTLPEIEVVERDALTVPGTNVDTATKHMNRYEADVTLSASRGVIVTTLQQLKQKPLPGHTKSFSVRDRIQSVAVRYEQIHVLVHEARLRLDGDQTVTGILDRTDADALSDLISFGTTLDADVEVHYIAGGETELAQWLAALISVYSVSDISLLQEETLWERFLRYAGLNAFASQAILGQLKRVESDRTEMSSSFMEGFSMLPYGLAAFLQMRPEQRLEQFGPLMGGDGVLRRVNAVIDSQWMSAANAKQ